MFHHIPHLRILHLYLFVFQTGQFVLCQPESLVVDPGLYQLNNQGSIMDCCVSDTFQCLGFGDEAGKLSMTTAE
jgi:hypothetical protein